MKPFKFGYCPSLKADQKSSDADEPPAQAEYIYPDIWDAEELRGAQRLIVAPSQGHVSLLSALCAELAGPFWLLYVLLVSRRGEHAPGRYQSDEQLTHAALKAFLNEFGDYLEGDGRHHVWVHSPAEPATLVYDNHNVIYAYGPLDRFERVVAGRGLRRHEVRFPVPHGHAYNPEHDEGERRIMTSRTWNYSPLREGDDPGRA